MRVTSLVLLLSLSVPGCAGSETDDSVGGAPHGDSSSCEAPLDKATFAQRMADRVCTFDPQCDPSAWPEEQCRATWQATAESDATCVDGCDAAACVAAVEEATDCATYEAALESPACDHIIEECP